MADHKTVVITEMGLRTPSKNAYSSEPFVHTTKVKLRGELIGNCLWVKKMETVEETMFTESDGVGIFPKKMHQYDEDSPAKTTNTSLNHAFLSTISLQVSLNEPVQTEDGFTVTTLAFRQGGR